MPSPTDFENQLALPRGQVQRLFGLVLLGHVHAVVQHERPLAGQLHAPAAERQCAGTRRRCAAAATRPATLPAVSSVRRQS